MVTQLRGGADGAQTAGGRLRITLTRRLPITAWLPAYRAPWLRADALAGLTVMGLLLPEAMAYAQLAGAPPVAGLYATLAGLVLYAVFGTSRQIICSPTSTAAIMTAAAVASMGPHSAGQTIALVAGVALLTGIISVVAGVARLGFIASFISLPVASGYLFGLALIIIVRQVPKLLGIVVPSNRGFFGMLWRELTGLGRISGWTLLVSCVALALLFGLRRWRPHWPAALLALALGILAGFAFNHDSHGVALVGTIPAGLPTPHLPGLSFADIARLAPSAAGITVVVFAEALSGARTFATRHRYDIDPNQELIALGTANLGAGALGGMPVSGGVSGSALNDASGARTEVSSLLAAAVMLVTLLVLTPIFRDLPEAVLGAIVVRAVWGLLNVRELRRYGRARAIDLGLALVALLAVVGLGVLTGLGAAVALSLLVLIYRSSRPHAAVLGRVPGERTYTDLARHPENEQFPGLLIFRLDAQLFFANAGFAHDRLSALVTAAEPPPAVVLWDLEVTTDLDITSADMLRRTEQELRAGGTDLMFARVRDPVRDTFRRSGLLRIVGEDHVFLTVDDGVQHFLAGPDRRAD
jgi:SulP family sulfate permease